METHGRFPLLRLYQSERLQIIILGWQLFPSERFRFPVFTWKRGVEAAPKVQRIGHRVSTRRAFRGSLFSLPQSRDFSWACSIVIICFSSRVLFVLHPSIIARYGFYARRHNARCLYREMHVRSLELSSETPRPFLGFYFSATVGVAYRLALTGFVYFLCSARLKRSGRASKPRYTGEHVSASRRF